jgi:hypothetical protein
MNMQIIPDDVLTAREHFDREAREYGAKTFDERLAESAVQISGPPESSFEEAAKIVRARLVEVAAKLKADGHGHSYSNVSLNSFQPEGHAFCLTVGGETSFGASLAEALSKIRDPKEVIEERKAKLRSELAALENEQQPALTA